MMKKIDDDGEVASVGKRKILSCPHCLNPIEIIAQTEIAMNISDGFNKIDWRSTLPPDQLAIIESAEKSGILKAFEDVALRVNQTNPPKNIAKFFLIFLRSAVQKRISTAILFRFIKMFSGAKIEFWSAQGLGVIVADKQLRAFFPLATVAGKSVRAVGKKSGSVIYIPPDEEELQEIIRTRFGFVNGKGGVL